MVKKRLIGLITVKDGLAVQSFSYNNYLPIGRPECLVENLDRWGADEILIQVIDRTEKKLGPDFELLKKIGKLRISTPIIYCGGIRNYIDAIEVIKQGSDRIIVDYLIRNNQKEVSKIAKYIGSQAIIGALPVFIKKKNLFLFNYDSGLNQKIDKDYVKSISDQNLVSEILLINKEKEGFKKSFNLDLINFFPKMDSSIIAFGGISEISQIKSILNINRVSAVAVGNFLNYKEHSIQVIKEFLDIKNIRKPKYSSKS
ncbi:MAG: hypothetical protein CMC88_04055 [Flavobacteriaceae bacterium]|nr:hypothetical protein [Flavobacteriaceae bacterium]|tara:strand:- start:92683 stop:93453 length:771 start_codon:yes stop_codon:yes gene_type:complete